MAWKEVLLNPQSEHKNITHLQNTKGEAYQELHAPNQAVISLEPPLAYTSPCRLQKPEPWWKSFQPLNFNSVPQGTWGQTACKGGEVCGHVGVALGMTQVQTELINGLRLKLVVYNYKVVTILVYDGGALH